MNKEALKKALLQGVPTGIVTWLIYGLVFQALIDKKPVGEALFGRDSLVFLLIFTVMEIVLFYFTNIRKSGKN